MPFGSPTPRPRAAERLSILAALGILVLAAILARGMMLGRTRSDLLFYACAVLASGVSLLAGRLATASGSRLVLPILGTGAILLRLWFVLQPPTLSGDLYRYIWDGRVVDAGFNPYLHVPADPALVALRDPAQYGLIDKRDYAVTIYPPVAEAIFAIVTRVSSAVPAMKLAMVLLEGVAVWATLRLLARLGRPAGLVTIYLLHPAPLWEFAGNGHVDAAMMAFLFAAFAWSGGGLDPYRSALVVALGTLVKPTAVLGLPAFWRPWHLRLPLFVLGVAALCYLPFVGAGTGVAGFLPHYAQEQGLDTGQGFFALAALQRLGLFHPAMTAGYVATSGLLLVVLSLWTRRGGSADLGDGLRGTAILLVAFLLLLSPVFPWYVLVTLPLTPLLGLWSPFALATGGFLLYGFNADAPPFFGRWSLMMGLAVLAAIRDVRSLRRKDMLP